MSTSTDLLPQKRPHSHLADSPSPPPSRRVRPRTEPNPCLPIHTPPLKHPPAPSQPLSSESEPESSDISSLITSEDGDSDSGSEISTDETAEDGIEQEEGRRTPLRARLTDFLGRLREANGKLDGGAFELVDKGGEGEAHVGGGCEGGEEEVEEPYIEMELGLGVLEEVEGSESGSADGVDNEDVIAEFGTRGDGMGRGGFDDIMHKKTRTGVDVLGRLMGRTGTGRRPEITEVDDG